MMLVRQPTPSLQGTRQLPSRQAANRYAREIDTSAMDRQLARIKDLQGVVDKHRNAKVYLPNPTEHEFAEFMLDKPDKDNNNSSYQASDSMEDRFEQRQEAQAQQAGQRIIDPNRAALPCLTGSSALSPVRQKSPSPSAVLPPSQPTPTPLLLRVQSILPIHPQAGIHGGAQAVLRRLGPCSAPTLSKSSGGGVGARQPSVLGGQGTSLSQASRLCSWSPSSSPARPAPAPEDLMEVNMDKDRVARLEREREGEDERERDRTVGLTPPPPGRERPSERDQPPRRSSLEVEEQPLSFYASMDLDNSSSAAASQ